jgi:hypothetical protein
MSTEDPDENLPISLDQAKKLCLKREFLEKIVHEAYFDKVVPGLFVRIGIGASSDGKPTYRMAEISNSQDGEKIYNLGKKATTKLLELKIGSDRTRKVYSMETISNHSLTEVNFFVIFHFFQSEFEKWCEELKKQTVKVMSVAEAKRRFSNFIALTRNHTYDNVSFKNLSFYKTQTEVDLILQKKKELNILPTNFSQRVKELEYALRIAMDEVPKNAEKYHL